MSPAASLAVAEAELARVDPVLAGLIEAWGPCPLRPRAGGRPHFETLARSIAYQQLAGRAAEVIWGRVRALVPGPFTPAAVVELDEVALRGAGLSGSKARSIADLASRVATGDVRLASLSRRSDEDVIAELSRVRGIGRWTAEMFLLFQLGRLDVWPVGDLGVRRGFGLAWGLAGDPTPLELEVLGDPFRPWRSVVAWYCWRAADTRLPAAAPLSTDR